MASSVECAAAIGVDPMALNEDATAVRHLYRPIVFLEPDRAVSPASWLDYTPFAFWIVDALRPSRFVELGCHSGNSYASFAQAVRTLGLPTACYGIDTWRGDPHAGFFDEGVFEEWSAYHDRHFSTFSTLIRSTFDDASEHFAANSIDLLHLDGYHTFEAASHDFETWRPKLSRRSVVLYHDINVRERDFGVWRLWERLRDEYPSFEFLHGHGLGVLGTGNDLPEAVEWLLSLRARHVDLIDIPRRFFSRLGAAVAARYSADTAQQQLRGELAVQAEQLAHKSTEISSLSRDLESARGQVAQATADVARLNGELANANGRLDEATADITRLNETLAGTNGQLAQAGAEVARLGGELAGTTGRLACANVEIERLRVELDHATVRISTGEAEACRARDSLERAEQALTSREAETERLAGVLRVCQGELDHRARHIERFAAKIADLTKRVDVLATDLDAREAEIVRLKRDRDQFPRALGARDAIIGTLDAEAAAAVEQLHRTRSPRRRGTAQRLDAYDTSRVRLSSLSLAPAEADRPTIVVLSHVGAWQPRAGNEYRVRRMLEWYRRSGYRVVPIVAPLPGEEVAGTGLAAMASDFGNAVQCHRDGRIEYVLHDAPPLALQSLNRTFSPSLAGLLGESGSTPHERELLRLERMFCHDVAASTVLHVSRSLGPHVLQVEYIWMTRVLPLVHGPVLKVVDTHDVFSSVSDKVQTFGVADVAIDRMEEAERLRRADLAIAIQDNEGRTLRRLAPSVPIVTAGVDFDVVSDDGVPVEGQILYVASNNARNRKGLEDFLRLAWPRIHRLAPHATLLVAGSVSHSFASRELPGVRVLDRVDDLTAQYRDAALVINPAVAGTGLKIKILEALCHFRPVVTWPAGVDGLDPGLTAMCRIARDWYDFSEQVASALTGARATPFTSNARAVIASRVDPARVYGALDAKFSAFFDRQRGRDTAGRFRSRSNAVTVGHAAD